MNRPRPDRLYLFGSRVSAGRHVGRDDPRRFDPGRLLPKPPATTLGATVGWSWRDIIEGEFYRLLRDYGE